MKKIILFLIALVACTNTSSPPDCQRNEDVDSTCSATYYAGTAVFGFSCATDTPPDDGWCRSVGSGQWCCDECDEGSDVCPGYPLHDCQGVAYDDTKCQVAGDGDNFGYVCLGQGKTSAPENKGNCRLLGDVSNNEGSAESVWCCPTSPSGCERQPDDDSLYCNFAGYGYVCDASFGPPEGEGSCTSFGSGTESSGQTLEGWCCAGSGE